MNPVAQRSALHESHVPGAKLFSRGKVRDIYEVDEERLLVVATDRLSAFDVVMNEDIPDKGRVLNQLSCFWFRSLEDVVPTHFLTAEVEDYPPPFQAYRDLLEGRSMLVRRARPFPVECIVRGYLAGSGWKDYQRTGTVCGIPLPAGLAESARLERPIFTPSTKATEGHDENITQAQMEKQIGREAAEKLKELTLRVYEKGRDYAEGRGIIMADTKLEWGRLGDEIILIDEVLTPDSSRFWPREGYRAGQPQPSFDKQFVRDYLERTHWNKQPPPPRLPPDVVEKTSEKYREAYRRLAGHPLD